MIDNPTAHMLNFLISLSALGGIVLALIWIGSMKTKVETMWAWWINHAGRGTKIRMKGDDDDNGS